MQHPCKDGQIADFKCDGLWSGFPEREGGKYYGGRGSGQQYTGPTALSFIDHFPSPHSPIPLRDFPEFEVQSGDPLKENIPNTPISSYSATLIHSTLFRTHLAQALS